MSHNEHDVVVYVSVDLAFDVDAKLLFRWHMTWMLTWILSCGSDLG